MNIKPHILIVDDDAEIRSLLVKFLTKHDLRVDAVSNGKEMKAFMLNRKIDLIVLDLMLPEEDGLTIIRNMRAEKNQTPVIMLTAAGEDVDRILGLEMGADDYMPKPFNPRELVARIKTVLRRTDKNNEDTNIKTQNENNIFYFENFEFDADKRTLTNEKNDKITLSAGEFNLLLAFVEKAGRTLSRDFLLDLTKGRDASSPFDRSIDIQVSRLRKKIGDENSLIVTVRGGGYIFTPTVTQNKNGAKSQ